jgi:hypothetical protein
LGVEKGSEDGSQFSILMVAVLGKDGTVFVLLSPSGTKEIFLNFCGGKEGQSVVVVAITCFVGESAAAAAKFHIAICAFDEGKRRHLDVEFATVKWTCIVGKTDEAFDGLGTVGHVARTSDPETTPREREHVDVWSGSSTPHITGLLTELVG